MTSLKKILIATGSRAEYGLLSALIKKLSQSNSFECKLAVTGSHLSEKFGETINEIKLDGHEISFKQELDFTDDTDLLISKNIAKCISEFSNFIFKTNPDLLIVLGDRYEIFGVAVSAFVNKIPIAHIHGGELTFGAIDDGFRHAITKLSQIHFASTEQSKNRIIQMGESPKNVFNVGAIGLNNIEEMQVLDKDDLEDVLDLKFKNNNFIVTFHPETLDPKSSIRHLKELLNSLDNFKNSLIIFTLPNADAGNADLRDLIQDFSLTRDNCYSFSSLGHNKYISLLKIVDCVIGNSSSGIIEAPFLKTPTVNIGNRQAGREFSKSVINCDPDSSSITSSINKALSSSFVQKINSADTPYYSKGTVNRVIEVIESRIKDLSAYKEFHDVSP